jgi:predicted Zn-ribbon and HTH transcriptional regulator
MAELNSKIHQNCNLLEYADDVTVYSVNRNNTIGMSEVEKHLQNIEIYLEESGLEMEPNKCQLCIFDNKKK